MHTFYIPLDSCRAMCVGTLSALGPSGKWKTHAGRWVLISDVTTVSFIAGQGVLPYKRERHVQSLKEQHPRCSEWSSGATGSFRLTDIQGGA